MIEAEITVTPVLDLETLGRVYAFDQNAYIDRDNSVSENIPFSLFREWWEAFPTGFLSAFHDNQPFALIGFFPVTKAWANAFLNHRLGEQELRAGMIKSSDRKTWYFSGLSSNARQRSLRSGLPCVLGRALLTWVQFNFTVVDAHEIAIVSEGTTSIGEALLGKMFHFEPFPALIRGQKPRFKLETSAKEIMHLLAEGRFFGKCKDLGKEVRELGWTRIQPTKRTLRKTQLPLTTPDTRRD